ncbi:MAG: MBOAT family protein [Clostridiales bacterium]|nr:MBOAT family protein [Clostridiales bacterium]
MFFTGLFNNIFDNIKIPEIRIILPMGISFYTFQAVGYSIDVYKRKTTAEPNFFKFTLFLSFFPQLVAGPIERGENLMPQLFTKKNFDMANIILGLKYMLFGFFKKIVIADRVSVLVDTVYNNPGMFEGLAFLIATIFFAFQIYCDFSGYSEIARGSAKILGIDLMVNFKTPYFSKSIKEFWRRWHISLSSWFKDYIYFPLGGSRHRRPRKYFNMLVVFLVSGLWHGANITFVIWGFIHGAIQILEDIIMGPVNKGLAFLKLEKFFVTQFIKIAATFSIASLSWVFFRANNFSDSIYIIKNIFSLPDKITDAQYIYNTIGKLGLSYFEFLIAVFTLLILSLTDFFSRGSDIHTLLSKKPFIIRAAFYYIITMLVFTLGVFSNASTFIYFQF